MDFIKQSGKSFAFLKIYVDTDDTELKELYREHIRKHNTAMNDDSHPNSGFDLFIPESVDFYNCFETKFVNMKIKTEMIYYPSEFYGNGEPSAYYIYPRSSISKTNLMVANHIGIIDMGYRGELITAFRYMFLSKILKFPDTKYTVQKHTRLTQICHPSLCRIFVDLVDTEEELTKTTRGHGAFGSTGIVGEVVVQENGV
jgi:dUTP pyrophosphatase